MKKQEVKCQYCISDDHIFHCKGPRPILGGPLLSGTDIGDTEGDFVAKGESEG